MLDPKRLDDLARRLAENAPKGVKLLQDDLNRSFRATLEAGLAKLDLVTREEFDVQAAVLARSRERLEALEQRLAQLEVAAATAAQTRAHTDAGTKDDLGGAGEPGSDDIGRPEQEA